MKGLTRKYNIIGFPPNSWEYDQEYWGREGAGEDSHANNNNNNECIMGGGGWILVGWGEGWG